MSVTRQLSLFGIEARAASPLDVEGLLAGGGQVVRMGGTARVSVVVADAWRGQVLLAECAGRGVGGAVEPAVVEGHLGFRTAYSAALAPLGAAWLKGAVKHPPAGLVLDARRLRLWVAAGGEPDGTGGYTLRLGSHDGETVWGAVGAALAAAGLVAALLGPRAGGPAYRIAGRRGVGRLAEIVGEAPPAAPAGAWPG